MRRSIAAFSADGEGQRVDQLARRAGRDPLNLHDVILREAVSRGRQQVAARPEVVRRGAVWDRGGAVDRAVREPPAALERESGNGSGREQLTAWRVQQRVRPLDSGFYRCRVPQSSTSVVLI